MATAPCPYCGEPVRAGAAFCPNCGRTLPTTQSLISAPLQPGMILHNRYRIERRLGKGGAGDVYLARDTQLFNRPVVVKRLRVQETDAKDRQEAEHNFQREAQALAELNNPRFPQIMDFFTDPPLLYLVMEFVAGENLDNRLEELHHALPEDEVLSIASQMAQLLVYLHGQNPPIVHRDIKPANIIIDNAGQITLVDFGIARAKAIKGDGKGGSGADSAAWGTPGFAPPEQIAGRTEPKSDIYALGATLHQLITNRDPRDHIGEPFPPAHQLNRAISTDFSDLLVRMLDPNPAGRPDARALLDELMRQDTMAKVARTTGHLPTALPATAPPPAPAQPVPAPAPPAPKRHQPVAASRAFIFATGDTAADPIEFARLADRNWDEARTSLYSGRLGAWLRNLGDRNLEARAVAVTGSEPDQDIGLETFLEQTAPGLAAPQLVIQPPILDFGVVRPGGRRRMALQIQNSGRGALRARLRPDQPWIVVDLPAVTCRAGETQLVGVICVGSAGPAGAEQGHIAVNAGTAGATQVAIRVQAATVAPAVPTLLRGLGIGAVVVVVFLLITAVAAIVQGWRPLGAPPDPTATPLAVLPPTPGPLPPATANDWPQPGYNAAHTNYTPNEFGLPSGVRKTVSFAGGATLARPGFPLLLGHIAVTTWGGGLGLYDFGTQQYAWGNGNQTVLSGTVVIADGFVIAGIPNPARLAAFEPAQHDPVWTLPIPGLTQSDLVVSDGSSDQVVYAAVGNQVWAVAAADGHTLWTSPTISGTTTVHGPAVDTDTVYVSGGTVVAALDRAGGQVRWNVALPATQVSAVTVGASRIYVVGQTSGDQSLFYALQKADGTPVWGNPAPTGAVAAPALVPDPAGEVVFVTGDREVAAVSGAVGEELWQQQSLDVGARGDYLLPEPPLVAGRYVYVATNLGALFALDRADGSQKGTLTVPVRSFTLAHNPVVSNGLMYAITDGSLFQIEGSP